MPTSLTISHCRLALLPTETFLVDGTGSALTPAVMARFANGNGHRIYTVWEWAQENGIRMLHGGDTDKPRRERDCRLMDSVGNMQQKRAINRNVHKYKWLSDAVDESGRQMNEAAKSNTDTGKTSVIRDQDR